MSSLYCLFSDFECQLWPLKAISVKVIQGKVPLFFNGLAMFEVVFSVRQAISEILLLLVPYLTNNSIHTFSKLEFSEHLGNEANRRALNSHLTPMFFFE